MAAHRLFSVNPKTHNKKNDHESWTLRGLALPPEFLKSMRRLLERAMISVSWPDWSSYILDLNGRAVCGYHGLRNHQ